MIGSCFWSVLAGAAVLHGGFDLEDDDGGLVGSGSPGQWAWGDVVAGPGTAFSGNRAWATVLDGPYLNNALDQLALPSVDTASLQDPMLLWWQWVDTEPGDSLWLERKIAGVWTQVDPVYGYPDAAGFTGANLVWQKVTLDLEGATDLSQIRFVFSSNDSVAASGVVVDDVTLWDGDIAAPLLTDLQVLPDTDDLDGPYFISVDAQDNQGLTEVSLVYSLDGGQEVVETMANVGGIRFEGAVPGQPHDTVVSYRVEAADSESFSLAPEGGDLSFRVRLPAPRDLMGPSGVVHATEAILSWSPPESQHPVEGYRVYRGEVLEVETADTSAEVAVLGEGLDVFTVAAQYAAGEGDRTGEISLDGAGIALVGVDPLSVFQGETVRLQVQGRNLLFVQGDVDLDLGEGLEIQELEVFNVDRVQATVWVAEDAPTGLVDVRVRSGDLAGLIQAGLLVLDGAQRPALVRVSPSLVRQGSEVELELEATAAFEATPAVDLGEGVYVETVVSTGMSRIRTRVIVAFDAPLGEHEVRLDDGVRVFRGVTLRIADQAAPTRRCHQGSPTEPSGLWLVVAGFVAWRRKRPAVSTGARAFRGAP
jgi:hypothetical protein